MENLACDTRFTFLYILTLLGLSLSGCGPGSAEVETIRENRDRIREKLHGLDAPASVGGDFSFVVRPLPKIALCYICYLADEQFPAAVTCLFSANANRFMPNDGLADTGEYTSKKMLSLIAGSR